MFLDLLKNILIKLGFLEYETAPSQQIQTLERQLNYPDIAERVKSRGIKYLVHFTRMENLTGISKYGLITRQTLERKRSEFYFNDLTRTDGFKNSISLSVTFPNYKMFWKYKKDDESTKWVMILLNAYEVLGNLECAFNSTNASSLLSRKISIDDRKTSSAFDSMFYDSKNIRSRCELRDNETTDPQAEILCFSDIPLRFFDRMIFSNSEDLKFARKNFSLDRFKCEIDRKLFIPRHDYKYW